MIGGSCDHSIGNEMRRTRITDFSPMSEDAMHHKSKRSMNIIQRLKFGLLSCVIEYELLGGKIYAEI